MFMHKSKILRPEHFNVDFFIQVIPPQGLIKAELIYSHTAETAKANSELA
jgi:hypothetical protein